ncbi:MAG: ATP-binding protein [Dehalococcoidia bacterium]
MTTKSIPKSTLRRWEESIEGKVANWLPQSKATEGVWSPHFWIITALLALLTFIYYVEQTPLVGIPPFNHSFFTTVHDLHRTLFLIPIIYASSVFRVRGSLITSFVFLCVVLPRALLFSPYPEAIVRPLLFVTLAAFISLFIATQLNRIDEERKVRTELNIASQVLSEYAQRLGAMIAISNVTSQSLEIQHVLDTAADKVREVMDLETVIIFLLNDESQELELKTCRGVSEDFANGFTGLKVGEGFHGQVVQSGEPLLIDYASQTPGLTRELERREGIGAVLIVPLKAKGKVLGTLSVAPHGSRQFADEEVKLLTTIAGQIAIAIESARLYEKAHLAAQQALASERRYREIFESANDAIWIHDLDGNIIAANKASEKLTGYNLEDLLKMNVKSFLSAGSLDLAGQIRHKLFHGETVEQPYEQRLIRKDGTERILKLTTSLIMEDGKPKSLQHIARDVTAEKEMQDNLSAAYQKLSEYTQRLKENQEQLIQAEKLTSLGQMAASIAHEVNNPLSGVLVYTQLLTKRLRSDKLTKDVALENLSKMEAELNRSTKLIRNLLDFARQSPPTLWEVDINEIVSRAFDLAAHSAELQHIQVTKELSPAVPKVVADFDQLQQVCLNLIINAIQAMPEGGKLTIRTSIDNDRQVKIEIQDTGCGISPENMSKLFTPFFSTKGKKGVGLGLAVAYGIVQRHHGRIEVQSKVGEGTTFTIYLPLNYEEGKGQPLGSSLEVEPAKTKT